MTLYEVYVGNLEDPEFSWECGDWNGNSPASLTPYFPGASLTTYGNIVRRLESGQYQGKQTDWGAWVAKMTKQQIMEFIREYYEQDRPDRETLEHLRGRFQELMRAVEQLEEDRIYGLVAIES